MHTTYNRDSLLSFLRGFIMVFLLYIGFAAAVFQYRHPTANQLTIVKEFPSVCFFEQLDKYQDQ